MLQNSLTPAERELLKRTLEADFREFIRYFFWVQNGLKFQWNDHHELMVQALMECYFHRCKRLVINIPPRYSKTEIVVIMFVAWCMAKNPQCQFIHLSYSDDLAKDNSARIIELIQLDEYQQLWPISFNPKRSGKDNWRTVAGGGLKAGTAAGGVTGFGAGVAYTEGDKQPEETNPENVPFGGAILYDDPLKPDDAESERERKKTNRRINGTINSRTNAPWTPIIMIMQRLHDDDPTGFVMEGGTGEPWAHLKVPVRRKDGSPLWLFRHNDAELKAIQRADKWVYNGQYLQEPIPDTGDFFLAENARWYKQLPKELEFYGSSDYATLKKEQGAIDQTEHGIFGKDPKGNIYVVDWWGGQEKTAVWIEEQLDLAAKWDVQMWAGEGGPIKSAVEPFLTQRMEEREIYFVLKWFSHNHPNYKQSMARSFQGMWDLNRVYLPEDKQWAQDLLRQLTRFPLGTLDDKVDTCSLFARMIRSTWEPAQAEPEEVAPAIVGPEPLYVDDFFTPETHEW